MKMVLVQQFHAQLPSTSRTPICYRVSAIPNNIIGLLVLVCEHLRSLSRSVGEIRLTAPAYLGIVFQKSSVPFSNRAEPKYLLFEKNCPWSLFLLIAPQKSSTPSRSGRFSPSRHFEMWRRRALAEWYGTFVGQYTAKEHQAKLAPLISASLLKLWASIEQIQTFDFWLPIASYQSNLHREFTDKRFALQQRKPSNFVFPKFAVLFSSLLRHHGYRFV